ncbi:MAG: IPT/TIG domain-containing protein [Reyranella sp.]|uniref:IPT/TIG domain-containing protein n=1 Tax=Reyranella sp. TaxID=1929291 RepID=UPI003D0E0407
MPTDLFSGSGALSANWTVDQGTFNQSGGSAFGNTNSASSVARYSAETPSADHEAYVIGGPLGSGQFIGVCVRKAASSAFTCANFDWGTDGLYVSTWNAGVQTQVSGSPFPAPAVDTKVTLRAVGANLYLLYNDVVQRTWTSLSGLPASGTWGMTAYSWGTGTGAKEWGGTDLGAAGPAVISTSSANPARSSSLTITGTGFGSSQGTGNVKIDGATQTVTAWSDTSITVTVVRGSTTKYGVSVNLVVTANGGASSSPYALTSLQPQSGWAYVNLGTPNTTSSYRITASPDLASGDQLAYQTISGGVEVFTDATFSAGSGVTAFDVEAWTTTDGWGATATQTVGGTAVPVFVNQLRQQGIV